ncbi:MAG: BrnT family toxin [Devosia sp.]
MEFEWDEDKRLEVFEERGVDFLRASLMFEGPVLTKADRRWDYGEERSVSVGMVDDECYVVVHAKRSSVVKIITAWKGGRGERKEYQACYPGRASRYEGQG